MGKTSAAEALANKYSSRPPVPLIRLINGQLSVGDLQVALQHHEISTIGLSQESAQENLVRLISNENSPEFVILDNFESTDQVAALLPYHTESCIVATCRTMGKVSSSKFHIIDVSKMAEGEAVDMAIKLTPGLSRADARGMAELLECYPLAINHACGLITGAHIRIKDLCHDLRRKPHDITEENQEQKTLHQILPGQ